MEERRNETDDLKSTQDKSDAMITKETALDSRTLAVPPAFNLASSVLPMQHRHLVARATARCMETNYLRM
jgi:hypothetical protein